MNVVRSELFVSPKRYCTLNADLLVLRAIVATKFLLQGKYNNGGQKLRRSDLVHLSRLVYLSTSTLVTKEQEQMEIAYNVKYSFSKMHVSSHLAIITISVCTKNR